LFGSWLAGAPVWAAPGRPRRLRLAFGPGARSVRFDGVAAPGEVVRVRGETGRVRLGPTPGLLVELRADRRGHWHLELEALAVGEPEEPGDNLRIESAAGVERVAVWIEPLLGQWQGDADGGPLELGIVGVHAALVRSGTGAEVLLVSPPRRRRPDGRYLREGAGFAWDLDAVDRCELARLDAGTLALRAVPFERSGLAATNLFCSGHVHLADGRLLFAGGHVSSRPGDPATAGWLHLFDPQAQGPQGPGEGWRRVPSPLRQERWYPTLVTLPDGRVLIASGSTAPLAGDHRDHRPLSGYYQTVDAGFEIFDPTTERFVEIDPARAQLVDLAFDRTAVDGPPNPVTTYPALFLLPGGKAGVLFVQEAHRGWLHELRPADRVPLRLAPRCYAMVATRGSRSYPHYGSAVLLPFVDGATRLRVLVVGGQHERETDHRRLDDRRATTDTAEIFDYDAARPLDGQPGWRAVGPAAKRRALADSTLLSDGTVLVSGGVGRGWANHNREEDAVLEAELFDPATERFRPAASARFGRRYHSTALLLPDGTVLKMGSTGGFGVGRDEAGQPWTSPRFDAERYFPGTLWRGPRPRIMALHGAGPLDHLAPGTPFELDVILEEPGTPRVLLLRLGSVTHGLDMDQRAIELPVRNDQPGLGPGPGETRRLSLRAPASNAVAPPGDYQLVVIDGIGVPSHGRLVRIGRER
jgi:hypothetical protein